ncbi:MAG: MBL fold metallo-hydrolase [Desulfobacterales bacterium]|jgi:flavorubredoxin
MQAIDKNSINYDNPVEIADGIYWVGFYDAKSGLHCNPYLIVDDEEAVVIDGGSRPDFATVMMKILQTGMQPSQIGALLYQHYDPDLCGSIPNFEDIIERRELKIISAQLNLMFIRHYSSTSIMTSIEDLNGQYKFSSGRTLQFIKTPYSHSPGSFVSFDQQSGILFSSDIFGSYGTDWELFLTLQPECYDCSDIHHCPAGREVCPINDILNFHRVIMTSRKALKYSLKAILDVPFGLIAPQHGSIITDKKLMRLIFERLLSLKKVGIDRIFDDKNGILFTDLKKRFNTNEYKEVTK